MWSGKGPKRDESCGLAEEIFELFSIMLQLHHRKSAFLNVVLCHSTFGIAMWAARLHSTNAVGSTNQAECLIVSAICMITRGAPAPVAMEAWIWIGVAPSQASVENSFAAWVVALHLVRGPGQCDDGM